MYKAGSVKDNVAIVDAAHCANANLNLIISPTDNSDHHPTISILNAAPPYRTLSSIHKVYLSPTQQNSLP